MNSSLHAPTYDDLVKLRAALPLAATLVPRVSQWSVGMHVQHCGLTTIAICEALSTSTTPLPQAHLSLVARLVFLTGWIPRGRAIAPAKVVPQQETDPAKLLDLLEASERALTKAAELRPDTWFQHPVFGAVARDRALRFIAIHNRHHLKIAADIVNASRR